MIEAIERRILAAIRPVDGIQGLPLSHHLRIQGKNVLYVYNSQGEAVLLDAPGLGKYVRYFETQNDDPVLESVKVELSFFDPTQRYLPRRLSLKLPRDTDPAHVSNPNSIFRPINVELYLAPAAIGDTNWATLRVVVRERNTEERLPWTLLRVTNQDGDQLSMGMSDERGEAQVVVPGIPLYMPSGGNGPALTTETTVKLQAWFDVNGVHKLPAPGLNLGDTDPNKDYLPAPQFLAGLNPRQVRWRARGGVETTTIQISAGKAFTGDLLVSL